MFKVIIAHEPFEQAMYVILLIREGSSLWSIASRVGNLTGYQLVLEIERNKYVKAFLLPIYNIYKFCAAVFGSDGNTSYIKIEVESMIIGSGMRKKI